IPKFIFAVFTHRRIRDIWKSIRNSLQEDFINVYGDENTAKEKLYEKIRQEFEKMKKEDKERIDSGESEKTKKDKEYREESSKKKKESSEDKVMSKAKDTTSQKEEKGEKIDEEAQAKKDSQAVEKEKERAPPQKEEKKDLVSILIQTFKEPTKNINKESFFKTLLKYLSIKGSSGKEEEISLKLKEELEAIGLIEVEQDELGNVRGILPSNSSKHTILLSAHMDTVDIEEIEMRFEGKKLTNAKNWPLGADNRAGVTAIIETLKAIKDKEHPTIKVLFTVQEERGEKGVSTGLKKFIEKNKDWFSDVELAIFFDSYYSGPGPAAPQELIDSNFVIIYRGDTNYLEQLLLNSAQKINLTSPKVVSKDKWSGPGDAEVLEERTQVKNIIEFGNGVYKAHTRDEALDVEILIKQTEWLSEMVLNIFNSQTKQASSSVRVDRNLAKGKGVFHQEVNEVIRDAFSNGRAELIWRKETISTIERRKYLFLKTKEQTINEAKAIKYPEFFANLINYFKNHPELKEEFGIDFEKELKKFNIYLIQPRNNSPGLIVESLDKYQIAHASKENRNIYIGKGFFETLLNEDEEKLLIALIAHELVEVIKGCEEEAERVERRIAEERLNERIERGNNFFLFKISEPEAISLLMKFLEEGKISIREVLQDISNINSLILEYKKVNLSPADYETTRSILKSLLQCSYYSIVVYIVDRLIRGEDRCDYIFYRALEGALRRIAGEGKVPLGFISFLIKIIKREKYSKEICKVLEKFDEREGKIAEEDKNKLIEMLKEYIESFDLRSIKNEGWMDGLWCWEPEREIIGFFTEIGGERSLPILEKKLSEVKEKIKELVREVVGDKEEVERIKEIEILDTRLSNYHTLFEGEGETDGFLEIQKGKDVYATFNRKTLSTLGECLSIKKLLEERLIRKYTLSIDSIFYKYIYHRLTPIKRETASIKEVFGLKAFRLAYLIKENLSIPEAWVIPSEVEAEEISNALDEDKRNFHFAVRSSPAKSMPGILISKLDVPYSELVKAIREVRDFWKTKQVEKLRREASIPDNMQGGIIIQRMVYGNKNENSGAGVLFTRDPITGENKLSGRFAVKAQGIDIVSRTDIETEPIEALKNKFPKVYEELQKIKGTVEKEFKNVQEIEFVIEDGKLWILQVRDAKVSPYAQLKIVVDMANEGIISQGEMLMRIQQAQSKKLYRVKNKSGLEEIGRGTPSSYGAARGYVVYSLDKAKELMQVGKDSILVVLQSNENIQQAILSNATKGIITQYGHEALHESVLARSIGIPVVDNIRWKENQPKEGEEVVVDGREGIVYRIKEDSSDILIEDKAINITEGLTFDYQKEAEEARAKFSSYPTEELVRLHEEKIDYLKATKNVTQESLRINVEAHIIHQILIEREKNDGGEISNSSSSVLSQQKDENITKGKGVSHQEVNEVIRDAFGNNTKNTISSLISSLIYKLKKLLKKELISQMLKELKEEGAIDGEEVEKEIKNIWREIQRKSDKELKEEFERIKKKFLKKKFLKQERILVDSQEEKNKEREQEERKEIISNTKEETTLTINNEQKKSSPETPKEKKSPSQKTQEQINQKPQKIKERVVPFEPIVNVYQNLDSLSEDKKGKIRVLFDKDQEGVYLFELEYEKSEKEDILEKVASYLATFIYNRIGTVGTVRV
ncbi:MAG: hypothetical protein DRP72_01555, partial [Candidatus Omnitrophota bacterium]